MTAPSDMLPDLPATVLDDDGAEHRAYKRGEEVGHARGLAEGRGAVLLVLQDLLVVRAGPVRQFIASLIERIEADGQADPAGVERGRREAIEEAARHLRGLTGMTNVSALEIERHEAELKKGREAERQGARGR